jgi:cysteinyl-tRNA synthetase
MHMTLELYNTLKRAREPFVPADPGRVTMYVCGPTVYSYAHIGNGRPYVVFDVLARLLRRSYPLVYARNVTDVDDKINAAARAEGITIGALTRRYTDTFHAEMAALGVLPPDLEPRVTEHIAPIIAFIERLIAGGHAYLAESHVLFAIGSYAGYGMLSHRSRDDMLAGARVEVAPYKRDPADFVLWKPSAQGDIGWNSPWGYGRPGWHIECSTMVEAHLGATIDIHGGGLDLVFPHHENEIAQSTCAHGGAPMARYWVHNGLVHVDSEKMSKSLGNVLRLRDLLAEHPGEVVRLGLLTAHYRQPLDWTAELVVDAKRKLDRMYGALRDAGIHGEQRTTPPTPPAPAVLSALEDDLNTPKAIAELFELVRAVNRSTEERERRALAESLRAGGWILGLLQRDPVEWFETARPDAGGGALSEQEIAALLDERERLRRERKFAAADAIRDRLAAQDVVIEDGAAGSRWRRT